MVRVEAGLLGVEGLRTVHVRDRNRHQFELPIHAASPCVRSVGWRPAGPSYTPGTLLAIAVRPFGNWPASLSRAKPMPTKQRKHPPLRDCTGHGEHRDREPHGWVADH